jgi:hypothetical protein
MCRAVAVSTTGAAAFFLAACQPVATQDTAPPVPRHEGVETIPIDDELVSIIVWMSGPATEGDLIAYSRCAAAGYALNRGFGFARHVRTNVQKRVALGVRMRFTPSRRRSREGCRRSTPK